MAYTTIRYWFKYGCETDEMMVTWKEFNSLDKAIAYAHRYAKGIKFAGVVVENEEGKEVYEINSDGEVYDYRATYIHPY